MTSLQIRLYPTTTRKNGRQIPLTYAEVWVDGIVAAFAVLRGNLTLSQVEYEWATLPNRWEYTPRGRELRALWEAGIAS